MKNYSFLLLGAGIILAPLALAQPSLEARTKIDFPPEVLAYFRKNMHNRVEELDKIFAALAESDMKSVASITRAGLAKRGNHAPDAPRPGQYVPAEFRALDQGMHGIAEGLAAAASAANVPPTAQDYKAVLTEASKLVNTCNTCHSAYRIH